MESNGKSVQELEAEIARLTADLETERRKSAGLQNQILAAREQEAAMATLHRGAIATAEGRLAHARRTSR